MSDRRSPLDFYQPDGSAPLAPTRVGPRQVAPSWSDLYSAQRTLALADLPRADQEQTYDAWAPWVALLNEGRSWNRRYHNPAAGGANPDLYIFDETGAFQYKAPSREEQEARLFAALDARRGDPRFKHLPATLEAFHDQVVAQARQRVGAARSVTARASGAANLLTGIAAGVPTSFRDEYNIAAMPFGGIGRSFAMRLGTAALGNMAVEAVEQPFVARQRERLGYDLTAGEAGINVLAAGVFGAGLQAAGEGVAAAVGSQAARNAYARGRDVATQMRERIGWDSMTPGERGAVTRLERDADVADLSPFTAGAGTEQHMARIEEARQALENGAPVPEPARPSPAELAAGRRAARETLKAKIRNVESGGDPTIRNPRSSATGLYQFTDGTWLRMMREATAGQRPALGDAALLQRRTDPQWQEWAMNRLLTHNEAVLARLGVPETAGNLYLLHFAGEGGGAKILRAAGDTPIERLLKADAIAANPFLRGKTADDVIRWAHQKMGTAPHEGPVLSRDGFDGDDDAWAAAQREVDAAEAELAAARRAVDDADDPTVREVDTVAEEPAIPVEARPAGEWTAQPDPPPALTIHEEGVGHGGTGKFFTYREGEDAIHGMARIENGVLDLDVNGPGANSYGAAFVRRALRAFKAQYPEISSVKGFRTSGARSEAVDVEIALGRPREAAGEQPGANAPSASPARATTARAVRGSASRGPIDLRRFLAEAGGIRDDAGHDLVRGRDLQSYVPGAGRLIRKTGMTLDEARAMAAEAGYFHDRAPQDAVDQTTIADLLTLLDDTRGGLHYRLSDLGEVEARAARALDAEERAHIENDVEQRLEAYGMTLDADQTARIADLVERDRLTPDEAIVRVAQEDMQAAWAPERAAAQLDGWDDIEGVAAQLQTDSMEHDLRMLVEAGDDAMVRINDEGEMMRAADVIADLDGDEAAIAAARACMMPA